MATQSNPFIALILSAIVPGLGQIYNREAKKGWVILGSCLILGLLIYWFDGLNKITIALALLLLWASAIVDAYKVAATSGQASEFYYRKAYVVTMLLLVGPLALPLLWQSPNFSGTVRWIWTVIVVGAVLVFVATPYLMTKLIG
jgi:TM2 domain-containing membrane protein YozV